MDSYVCLIQVYILPQRDLGLWFSMIIHYPGTHLELLAKVDIGMVWNGNLLSGQVSKLSSIQ